jgi:hypothetical protein
MFLLFFCATHCIAQKSFKGYIVYKITTQSEESGNKEELCKISFSDSTIEKIYNGDTVSKHTDNLKSGISTFLNKSSQKKFSSSIVTTDSLKLHLKNRDINLADSITTLGTKCTKAKNIFFSKTNEEHFNTIVETKVTYYLSDFSYSCANPYISFDEIYNNGFGKIPLRMVTENNISILHKVVREIITYEALEIKVL